jgi:hypothetical protein
MMLYYKDESLANVRAIDIVDYTDSQLESLAQAQRAAIYKNHPLNKEVTRQELNNVLK